MHYAVFFTSLSRSIVVTLVFQYCITLVTIHPSPDIGLKQKSSNEYKFFSYMKCDPSIASYIIILAIALLLPGCSRQVLYTYYQIYPILNLHLSGV